MSNDESNAITRRLIALINWGGADTPEGHAALVQALKDLRTTIETHGGPRRVRGRIRGLWPLHKEAGRILAAMEAAYTQAQFAAAGGLRLVATGENLNS